MTLADRRVVNLGTAVPWFPSEDQISLTDREAFARRGPRPDEQDSTAAYLTLFLLPVAYRRVYDLAATHGDARSVLEGHSCHSVAVERRARGATQVEDRVAPLVHPYQGV